jgi:hypothetical protein
MRMTRYSDVYVHIIEMTLVIIVFIIIDQWNIIEVLLILFCDDVVLILYLCVVMCGYCHYWLLFKYINWMAGVMCNDGNVYEK